MVFINTFGTKAAAQRARLNKAHLNRGAGIGLALPNGETPKPNRWVALTADKAIDLMLHKNNPTPLPLRVINQLGLLAVGPVADKGRAAQILSCLDWYQPLVVIDDLPHHFKTDLHQEICMRHIEGLPDNMRRRLCLSVPELNGTAEEVQADMRGLGALARRMQCGLSVNLARIFTTSQCSGLRPKALLEILDAALIHIVELGFLGGQKTPKIEHEVWVLFSNFIDHIGLRPCLIVADAPNVDMAVLNAEAARADNLLNAVRQCGPIMGENYRIFG